jgi:hypothetical protein
VTRGFDEAVARRERLPVMRRALLGLILALAACASPAEEEQPLSPVQIRSQLIGGTLFGYEEGGQVYIYLAPNGVAVRNGAIAEYGQWRVDEARGLCFNWHGTDESCTQVYQIHSGRYRLGDVEYNLYGYGYGYGFRGYGPGMGYGPRW